MPKPPTNLEKARDALANGRREEANALAARVVKASPYKIEGQTILAETTDDPEERRWILAKAIRHAGVWRVRLMTEFPELDADQRAQLIDEIDADIRKLATLQGHIADA